MKGFLMGLLVLGMILGYPSPAPGQQTPPSQVEEPSATVGQTPSLPPVNTQDPVPPLVTPIVAPPTVDQRTTYAYGLDMVKAIGAFGLVMIVLFLSLKGLGRLTRLRGIKGGHSAFTLRGMQALDNRKYLAAVEIEGRLIVVGITPERITPVAHWFLHGEDDDLDFLSTNSATAPEDPPFTLSNNEFRGPNNYEELPDIRVAPHKERKK